LLVSLAMKCPIVVKVTTEVCCPQLEHGCGHLGGPAHPRPLNAELMRVYQPREFETCLQPLMSED
jgi:hypothetical protein